MRIKNIVLFILSFCFCFLLVGCQQNENEKIEEVTDSIQEVEVSEDLTLKGNFLSVYDDIEGHEIEKFLATAIVNVRPEEYRNNDFPIITEDDKNADLIFTLMGFRPEDTMEFAISTTNSNSRAYCVAIVEPKEMLFENVYMGIANRITDIQRSVADYPDQVAVANDYVFEQMSQYLILVICENADAVYEQLVKVMASADLSDLESVPGFTDEERESYYQEALEEEITQIESEVGEVTVTPIEDPYPSEETSNEVIEEDIEVSDNNDNFDSLNNSTEG